MRAQTVNTILGGENRPGEGTGRIRHQNSHHVKPGDISIKIQGSNFTGSVKQHQDNLGANKQQ